MQTHVQIAFDKLAAEYSAKYDNPTHIVGVEKIRRMELLVEYAQLLKPKCTLDAGCGPGVVLSALTRRLLGAKFAGVDLSFQMLRQAQSNNLEGVPFVQSSVEQLPFPDNLFDLIYALGVLDYLEAPDQFFKAVQRTVRPGGYFIFTYPNADSIARSVRASLRPHFGHSRAVISAIPLKKATVDRLITDHGFTLLRRHYITYGNGLVSFPWSVTINRKMEKWCSQRPVSRYLAWSCFCVARKGKA